MSEDKGKEEQNTDHTGEVREASGNGAEPSQADQKEPRVFSSHDLYEYQTPRDDLPRIRTGDIVAVHYRVIEGGKERIQVFEGTVIAQNNRGISRTVTVRKTSFGVSVERIFPLNSKLVQTIKVNRHSRIRRAKLYFLRSRRGRAARLKELR
ncbi:MAG TPA: 50S ribosomal protein L19 [Candidatus Aminicenantes bacterium]|nr:50S ribosomal protein L19 [Candidatus Aminicenantes bacterium]